MKQTITIEIEHDIEIDPTEINEWIPEEFKVLGIGTNNVLLIFGND